MALIKVGHRLEQVSFVFDDLGVMTDMQVTVNYGVQDDVTGVEETRVRKTISAWGQLTPTQRTAIGALGVRLQALAKTA